MAGMFKAFTLHRLSILSALILVLLTSFYTEARAGDLDGNGADEVILDFGSGVGIWGLYNNVTWQKIHPTSAEIIAAGDMDGNGQHESIIDFGPSGVWVRMNNASWVKLHPSSPESMTTGDIDGNGKDEVVMDFGNSGIWVRMNNASWTKLHASSPESMTTGDMDGNGKDEVVMDFGNSGIWVRMNNASWVKLHPSSPESMTTGDMDGNGKDEVVLDFGNSGIWVRMNNASWTKLHASNPDSMTPGDMDGNGKAEVILDFGGSGTWVRYNNATWAKLHPTSPELIATGDIDGNSKDDVILDFGGSGSWVRYNNVLWKKLHPGDPQIVQCSDTGSRELVCTDSDHDGYYFAAGCGTPIDCNDADSSIHPGASEICGNGRDDNCSGSDEQCSGPPNVILKSIYETEDTFGDLLLLGEVQNVGGKDAVFVDVHFEFKDSQGSLIGTDFAYVDGTCKTLASIDSETNTVLTPGEVGFFVLYTNVAASQVSNIDHYITWDEYATVVPDANISLIPPSGPIVGYSNQWGFNGYVRNSGTQSAIFAKVIFYLKDSAGNVIDWELSYVGGKHVVSLPYGGTTEAIFPNESIGFSDVLASTDYHVVNSYALKMDWSDYSGPPVSALSTDSGLTSVWETGGVASPTNLRERWEIRKRRTEDNRLAVKELVNNKR